MSDEAVARGGTSLIATRTPNDSIFRGLFQGVDVTPGNPNNLVSLNLLQYGLTSPFMFEDHVLKASFAPDRTVTDFAFGLLNDSYDFGLRSIDGNLVRGGFTGENIAPVCNSSAFVQNPTCEVTGRIQIVGSPSVQVPQCLSEIIALLSKGVHLTRNLAAVSGFRSAKGSAY